MIPLVSARAGGLLLDWSDYPEPADHVDYTVYYGTLSPPGQVWGNTKAKQVTLTGLTPGTRYYAQIYANDPFGPGTGSGVVDGVPE